jgi:hypothetical protein
VIQDTFKHNRARKNVIAGGMVILVAITLLSCVSSFMIYREGFADLPPIFQYALAMFAVIVVEGAFIWLVYGFTRAFTSFWERLISFFAMWGLASVMLTNIVTHFMMVKRVNLFPFQQSWVAWGAVSVFIGVLVIVLAITLADPVIRLVRLELKFQGKQEETILNARREGLESERVQQAISQRSELESEQLAAKVLGSGKYLQPHMIKGFSDGGGSSSYSYSPQREDDIEIESKPSQETIKAIEERYRRALKG